MTYVDDEEWPDIGQRAHRGRRFDCMIIDCADVRSVGTHLEKAPRGGVVPNDPVGTLIREGLGGSMTLAAVAGCRQVGGRRIFVSASALPPGCISGGATRSYRSLPDKSI